jgi:hypothetical protein
VRALAETTDMTLVNPILYTLWDEVWPETDRFDVPYRPECTYFLGGTGVVIFHPFRDGVKIHPNFILRGKRAYEVIEDSIQEMFSRGHTTIYAEIDVNLRHVRHAAAHLGFTCMEAGERMLYRRLA